MNCIPPWVAKALRAKITPSNTPLRTADNVQVQLVGQCELEVKFGEKSLPKQVFMILKGGAPLLSLTHV